MVMNFPSTQVPYSKPTACANLAFPSPHVPAPPHMEHLFLYTKTTLTSPILLSGTPLYYRFLKATEEAKILSTPADFRNTFIWKLAASRECLRTALSGFLHL
jgi:hypothetical protein